MRRPIHLATALVATLLFSVPAAVVAKTSKPETPKAKKPLPTNEEIEKAILRALDYVEGQQHADGHWENARRVHRRWATTWALLAFMANGHTARSGRYQRTVEKGLAYLARNMKRTFYQNAYWKSAGHIQAQCTFALLCAIGQGTKKVESEDLVILCEGIVQDYLRGQRRNREGRKGVSIDAEFVAGGWGPVPVSYWRTLCIVAARHAGMKIPRIALDDLRAFWKRHYIPAFGCYYDQTNWNNRSIDKNHGVRLTIPGVIAMCLLGAKDAEEVQGAVRPLRSVRPGDPKWFWSGKHHSAVCGGYHGGHAMTLSLWYLSMKLAGANRNDLKRWRAEYSGQILNNQLESGGFRFPGWERRKSWTRSKDKGYGTNHWLKHTLGYGGGWNEGNLAANAALGLGIPKGYLAPFTPYEEE